jgi:hypothetical protein
MIARPRGQDKRDIRKTMLRRAEIVHRRGDKVCVAGLGLQLTEARLSAHTVIYGKRLPISTSMTKIAAAAMYERR